MENIIELDDDSQPGTIVDSHNSIQIDDCTENNKSSCELADKQISEEDANIVHFCWMCISVVNEHNILDKSSEQLLKSFILQFTPSLVYTSNLEICINCYVYLGTSYNIIADFHDKMKILDDYFKVFSKLKDEVQVSYLKDVVDEKILAHKLKLGEKNPECVLSPHLRTNSGAQNSALFNNTKEKFQATFCKKNRDSDNQNTEYFCHETGKFLVESPSTVYRRQNLPHNETTTGEDMNGKLLDESIASTRLIDSNLRDGEIRKDLSSVSHESNSLRDFSFKIQECFTLSEDEDTSLEETSILKKHNGSDKSGDDIDCLTNNHILGNTITMKSIDESCVSIDSIAQEFTDVDLVAPNLMTFEGSLCDLEEQLPKNLIEKQGNVVISEYKSLVSDSHQQYVKNPPALKKVICNEIQKNQEPPPLKKVICNEIQKSQEPPALTKIIYNEVQKSQEPPPLKKIICNEIQRSTVSSRKRKPKIDLINQIENPKKSKVCKKRKASISVDMHITNINSEKVVVVDPELINNSTRKNRVLPSNDMGRSDVKLTSNEKAVYRRKHGLNIFPGKRKINVLNTSKLVKLSGLENSKFVKEPIINVSEGEKFDIAEDLYIMSKPTNNNFQTHTKPLSNTIVEKLEGVSMREAQVVTKLPKGKRSLGRNSSVNNSHSKQNGSKLDKHRRNEQYVTENVANDKGVCLPNHTSILPSSDTPSNLIRFEISRLKKELAALDDTSVEESAELVIVVDSDDES